ncbi:hypothetical protein ABAC460_09400 [Asticcacaulis sp. AC460]|uniref:hypothetical protein n=1 Tax=Asticcacaulis sp. AC460 TaxID=1282360 RepID=UPI0003C3D8A2|nr:hypothetical protein [Asticcacaulis sp. AC460]ESQ90360.1 hypothetical protein ABAC460_09400 [Asticcacaulis sp. AC460]
MATTAVNSESRDNATITILEMVVASALVLGIIFLLFGNATDGVTVISSTTDRSVVAEDLAAVP